MASTFIRDTIEGATISETATGKEATRRFIIQGVPGDELYKMKNTLDDDPRVPKIGDQHPAIPSLKLYSRDAQPVQGDNDTFAITCNYRPYTAQDAKIGEVAIIEYGSTLQTVQTNFAANGQLMTVTNQITGKEQGGTVDLQIPSFTLRAQRKELGAPVGWINDYTGTINGDLFWVGGISISAETARCNSITASTQDGGLTYNVTYEFEIAKRDIGNAGAISADPWDAVIVATDDATGRPITEPAPENGTNIKAFQMYNTRTFSTLELFG